MEHAPHRPNAIFKPSSVRQTVVLAVGIVLVNGLCLINGFVDFDDDTIFLDNPLLKGPLKDVLPNILDWSRADTWRPLRDLSHWLDWRLHGQSSFWSHAHNLCLLGVIAYLVRRLFARLRIDNLVADLTTVVSFVHPVQVEAIAWVSGRKELLAGIFFFAMLHVFHRFLYREQCMRWSLMTVCCFVLGLMSKGHIIVSPLVLLIYLGLAQQRDLGCIKRSRSEIVGLLFVFSSIACIAAPRIAAGGVSLPDSMQMNSGDSILLGDQFQLFIRYLKLIFVPVDLNHIYFTPALGESYWVWAVSSLVLFAGFIMLGLRWWLSRDIRGPLVALCIVGMLPYLHVKTGVVYMANRYLFLIMPFAVLILVESARRTHSFSRLAPMVKRILTSGIVLSLIGLAIPHHLAFRDSVSLWTRMTEVYSESPWGYDRLGRALFRKADYAAAAGAWLTATQRSTGVRKVKYLNNAAVATMEMGQDAMALELLRNALTIDPSNRRALFNLAIIKQREQEKSPVNPLTP